MVPAMPLPGLLPTLTHGERVTVHRVLKSRTPASASADGLPLHQLESFLSDLGVEPAVAFEARDAWEAARRAMGSSSSSAVAAALPAPFASEEDLNVLVGLCKAIALRRSENNRAEAAAAPRNAASGKRAQEDLLAFQEADDAAIQEAFLSLGAFLPRATHRAAANLTTSSLLTPAPPHRTAAPEDWGSSAADTHEPGMGVWLSPTSSSILSLAVLERRCPWMKPYWELAGVLPFDTHIDESQFRLLWCMSDTTSTRFAEEALSFRGTTSSQAGGGGGAAVSRADRLRQQQPRRSPSPSSPLSGPAATFAGGLPTASAAPPRASVGSGSVGQVAQTHRNRHGLASESPLQIAADVLRQQRMAAYVPKALKPSLHSACTKGVWNRVRNTAATPPRNSSSPRRPVVSSSQPPRREYLNFPTLRHTYDYKPLVAHVAAPAVVDPPQAAASSGVPPACSQCDPLDPTAVPQGDVGGLRMVLVPDGSGHPRRHYLVPVSPEPPEHRPTVATPLTHRSEHPTPPSSIVSSRPSSAHARSTSSRPTSGRRLLRVSSGSMRHDATAADPGAVAEGPQSDPSAMTSNVEAPHLPSPLLPPRSRSPSPPSNPPSSAMPRFYRYTAAARHLLSSGDEGWNGREEAEDDAIRRRHALQSEEVPLSAVARIKVAQFAATFVTRRWRSMARRTIAQNVSRLQRLGRAYRARRAAAKIPMYYHYLGKLCVVAKFEFIKTTRLQRVGRAYLTRRQAMQSRLQRQEDNALSRFLDKLGVAAQ